MNSTSLPHAFEQEPQFKETLYAWMDSAPWLAISFAFHLLLLFVLSAFPFDALRREQPPTLTASLLEPEPELVELPPEPLDELIEPVEEVDIDTPILNEVEPLELPAALDDSVDEPPGADQIGSDAPALSEALNDVIGIAGGGSKFGDRVAGRHGPGGGGGGRKLNESVDRALAWLAAHQSADGSWDADGFSERCGQLGPTTCDGAGRASQDVGVTGLALLAFLGQGDTPSEGPYRESVAKAALWLRSVQDPDSGLFGEPASHDFLNGHAIATLAMCEVYYATRSPLLRQTCQSAVHTIQRARNPYGAWRYDMPPAGANDTSITGWMVFALKAAEDAGLEVDPGSFEGALSWLDEATDPLSGRVGYNEAGSMSSRITGVNDHYPRERGEAMTAVGLLCRIFMGQSDPRESPLLERHAALLERRLPEWDPDGLGCDMYYWYYGTYAMFQLGGRHWTRWEAALKPAVLDSQRQDGDARGSWDPVGPWGFSGGRVYSTALMVLTEEVYYRYGRLTGAR